VVAFNQRLADWREDVRDLTNEREQRGVLARVGGGRNTRYVLAPN
jgi:hypothetical protein